MTRNSTRKAPRVLRCAIYTRKSTEEGLEQDFNSLDAQRESGEAFIKSQVEEGWECVPTRYDDGGYSGANTDRPALKRMLADIEAGKIDIVVVYKVDRLSRSLMDFARIMETFDRSNSARSRLSSSSPRGKSDLVSMSSTIPVRPRDRPSSGE